MDIKSKITIKDFDEICLLCIRRERRLKPLLKKEGTSVKQSLNEIIQICFGLEIRPDDGLPFQICGKCSNKLLETHSFRIQCLASYDFLKSLKLNHDNHEANELYENDWLDHDFQNDIDIDEKPNISTSLTSTKLKLESIETNDHQQKSDNGKLEITVAERKYSSEFDDNLKIELIKIEPSSIVHVQQNTPENATGTQIKTKRLKKENRQSKNSTKLKSDKPKPKIDTEKSTKPKFVKLTEEQKKERRLELMQGICPICGIYARNLNAHIKLKHNENKPVNESVECDYCHRILSDKQNLRKHFKSHFQVRSFKCSLCSYTFLHRWHLVNHMRIHTGEKPFKCEICSKTFRNKPQLSDHKKSHFQVRDIPCPYCDKMFLKKNNLRSHIGIHTGERPFKCDACDAAFVASSALATHRRLHKKEDPFFNQCKICFLVMQNRQLFKAHMRAVHEMQKVSMEIKK